MTSPTTKRPYRQRLRAESAAQTRQRIIESAREALSARRGFSISEIADQAGVVRSTLYTVFGSRQGLLRAVVEDMGARGGTARMREAFRHPDALVAVTRNFEEGTAMASAERAVALGIEALASVDADAAAVVAEMDQWRLEGLGSLVRRLGEQGYLRPEIDHDQAVDILFVLSAVTTHDQLHTGRDLSSAVVAQRLITIFRLTLCRPESLVGR